MDGFQKNFLEQLTHEMSLPQRVVKEYGEVDRQEEREQIVFSTNGQQAHRN